MPVASSIVHPTSPTSAASRIVSATTSGASPNPFSRSAETGKSVASTIDRACANAFAVGRKFFPLWDAERAELEAEQPTPGTKAEPKKVAGDKPKVAEKSAVKKKASKA